jgi:hypothetical protein
METIEKADLLDDAPQVINADLRKFNRTEQMVTKAVTELAKYTVIVDMQTCNAAMEALREAKEVEKAIEKKREELGKPFFDAKKKIDAKAKEIVAKLPDAIVTTKQAVLAFQQAEIKKALEARKKAREEQLAALGFTQQQGGFVYPHSSVGNVSNYTIEHFSDDQWSGLMTSVVMDIKAANESKKLELQDKLEDVEMFGSDEEAQELIDTIQNMELETSVIQTTIVAAPAKVKGITKRWVFELVNLKEVPVEYLQVNETAIREAIAKGTRLIPGIKIFQQESLSIR